MLHFSILGAGSIARTMASTLRGMKDEIVPYAIAARDGSRAEVFRKEFGFTVSYGSYEEMLNDPKVDLVYIAVPHSLHYKWTIAALNAGKNVLCEKSFAANEQQAREMIELAEKKKLLLTEAIWPRYQPSRKIINDAIESGIIGKVHTVTANIGYPLSHIERMIRPELAGGALLDLSVYLFNFSSMLLGDHIRRLSASCIKAATGVDAQENFYIEYENGAMASMFATMYAQTDQKGIICGDKGFIEVENFNNPQKITAFRRDGYVKTEIESWKIPKQITGYEYEVRSAIKAIEEGKTECPEMPHSETLEIMRQMDEARRQFGLVFPFEQNF